MACSLIVTKFVIKENQLGNVMHTANYPFCYKRRLSSCTLVMTTYVAV